MPEKIIGHGTWYDKTAKKIVEREQKLGRSLDLIRTESGLGASGFPHIGSFADCARSYAVALALQEQGINAEYIAFADDLDGLRKVPAGMPDSLSKYLGYPVTSIPDLYGCHDSFGEHMTGLLLESLDETGINYSFKSAKKSYEQGLFVDQIRAILMNAKKVGFVKPHLDAILADIDAYRLEEWDPVLAVKGLTTVFLGLSSVGNKGEGGDASAVLDRIARLDPVEGLRLGKG